MSLLAPEKPAVTVDMYSMTVPVLVRALKNLSHLLDKAEAHVEANGLKPEDMLGARLIEDMLALVNQVQLASDTAKGAVARLAGVENPSFADIETTFDELHHRIDKTIEFIKSVDRDLFAGAETRDVTLKVRGGDLHFKGYDYLTGFVLPNLFFHVTTAYGIIRHKGVKIGKLDYLGPR